jgi:two-component system response regulator NreC
MPSYLQLASDPAPAAEATFVSLPIRVVVADDHTLLRRSLRLLLDRERDFEVIAEAGDLASAARHVESLRPAVLVLDLRMPGGSSVDLVGRLRRRVPETRIVVLTMQRDPGFARRALAAGALGFVLKDLADVELPAAVRATAHGQEYISPGVGARLDGRHRPAVEGGRSRA